LSGAGPGALALPWFAVQRSIFMMRVVASVCALAALVLFAAVGTAADKAQKNQMVKGTIKSVDANKAVLVVNQQVKNEKVDRELSILDSTEFVIMTGNEKKEATGKEGLLLLEGKEGASVAVKCDKDVNVLKVTVTIKK
jgi:hypothetical protein